MSKASEIKRLTTPLKFRDAKAYDAEDNLINCVETLSDVRFPVEPKPGILNDDEILQYAPQSKAASHIRLTRGFGTNKDVLTINHSLPWLYAFFYTILICIAFPAHYVGNRLVLIALLVLAIIPLIYAFTIFNLKKPSIKQKRAEKNVPKEDLKVKVTIDEGLDSLKPYQKEADNLKVLFDIKEKVVKDLIAKKFEPPQITYTKFISLVDSAHKIFYEQHDAAVSIAKLAAEDSPRIREELDSKIGVMKSIISQIEDLTNELVINVNEQDSTTEEINSLLEEMGNVIDTIKEY